MITNHKGTTQASWLLANGAGKLVWNSGVFELHDSANATVALRVLGIPTTGQENGDVPNYLDMQGIGALITYSFDGATPPAGGANAGEFGFCHSTGGSYTAGDVVYDSGAALVKQVNVRFLVTSSAVTGTVSLNANGIYVKEGATWTLKGDGTASGAYPHVRVAFAYNSLTPTSTTSIPDTAEIVARRVVITQAFNGTTPTVAVVTDGSSGVSLVATSDFDITQAEQYGNDDIVVLGADKGGHVAVTCTVSGASAGVGYVEIFYGIPTA